MGRQRGEEIDNSAHHPIDIGEHTVGARGPGEEHHPADEITGPERLIDDRRQTPAALGIAFIEQERLRPGGDVGQRIVDFVPRAVGQFADRVEAGLAECVLEGHRQVRLVRCEADDAEEIPPFGRQRRGPRASRRRDIPSAQPLPPDRPLGEWISRHRPPRCPGQPRDLVDLDHVGGERSGHEITGQAHQRHACRPGSSGANPRPGRAVGADPGRRTPSGGVVPPGGGEQPPPQREQRLRTRKTDSRAGPPRA